MESTAQAMAAWTANEMALFLDRNDVTVHLCERTQHGVSASSPSSGRFFTKGRQGSHGQLNAKSKPLPSRFMP